MKTIFKITLLATTLSVFLFSCEKNDDGINANTTTQNEQSLDGDEKKTEENLNEEEKPEVKNEEVETEKNLKEEQKPEENEKVEEETKCPLSMILVTNRNLVEKKVTFTANIVSAPTGIPLSIVWTVNGKEIESTLPKKNQIVYEVKEADTYKVSVTLKSEECGTQTKSVTEIVSNEDLN